MSLGRSGQPAGDPNLSGERNERKARRFFDTAEDALKKENFERAIECYLDGLRFDPEDTEKHKELRQAALSRRNAGGKPLGKLAQLKRSGGKTPLERLLNAEHVWSYDPNNANLALKVARYAVDAGLEEFAHLATRYVMAINKREAKPNRNQLLKASEMFEEIGAFDKAIEALRQMMKAGQINQELLGRMGKLEQKLSKNTTEWKEEVEPVESEDDMLFLSAEGGTRSNIEARDRELNRFRIAYQKDPNNGDAILGLARSLAETGRDADEDEAIKLLQDAHHRLREYRFKMEVGTVRLARFDRFRRRLRKKLEVAKDQGTRGALEAQIRDLAREQLAFELKEYADRANHHPDDLPLRFELGMREAAVGDFNAAIKSLRVAADDRQLRPKALGQIAKILMRNGRSEEAAKILEQAVAAHPEAADPMGLALRYDRMKALLSQAKASQDVKVAEAALALATEIASLNVNYRDIREDVERVSLFAKKLRAKSNEAAA